MHYGEHDQQVGRHAMIELDRQVVLERTLVPWHMSIEPVRDQRAVHQWPGGVDKTGLGAGHEGPEHHLQKNQ